MDFMEDCRRTAHGWSRPCLIRSGPRPLPWVGTAGTYASSAGACV